MNSKYIQEIQGVCVFGVLATCAKLYFSNDNIKKTYHHFCNHVLLTLSYNVKRRSEVT